jgi:sortase A
MKQYQKYIPIIFLAIGAFFIGKSLFYYSKGLAAQYFIENAWKITKESQIETKPWSWADFNPVAKLEIESIGLNCIVMNQISGEALTFGPGHLSTTAKPGQSGNMVIAGHRDGHFNRLRSIQKNDIIKLGTMAEKVFYIVTEILTTSNQDIYWTEDTKSDVITLITCYPFNFIGDADDRFIVRAEKINPMHSASGNRLSSTKSF